MSNAKNQKKELKKIYEYLGSQKLDEGLKYYKQSSLEDLNQMNPDFFSTYGVGVSYEEDSLFIRFKAYELLLNVLHDTDTDKFNCLHKGTAYYFLAWVCLQLEAYEKMSFYLDCAISEDIRREREDIRNRKFKDCPLYFDLVLKEDPPTGTNINFRTQLRSKLENYLNKFKCYGLIKKELKPDQFMKSFVNKIFSDTSKNHSALLSLFITYLFQIDTTLNLFKTRSSNQKSFEFFLISIFKGGLLFESLLKFICCEKWSDFKTLGDIFNNQDFKPYFSIQKNQNLSTTSKDANGFKKDINGIIAEIDNYPCIETIPIHDLFSFSAKLRNVSGHNISISITSNSIQKVLELQLYSVMFIILKEVNLL